MFHVGYFVNVYEVDQCYGGPEEGSWYYDAGSPLASYWVPIRWIANRLAAWLHALPRYSNEGHRPRYSVIGDADFEVYVERHKAVAFPEFRPVYE